MKGAQRACGKPLTPDCPPTDPHVWRGLPTHIRITLISHHTSVSHQARACVGHSVMQSIPWGADGGSGATGMWGPDPFE